MDDKVKIHGGPAFGQLVHLANYRVNPSLFPSGRMDHIASMGKAKKIIEAIFNCVRTPPFLFIVNLQVPGTPCLRVAMFFALPCNFESRDITDDATAFRAMLERYIEDMDDGMADPSTEHTPDQQDDSVGLAPSDNFRNQRF
eukprot:FR744355.1.p2 GENE.FR744355.1~~FR744355.1.p2  ORF type:complete len:142 (+),score=14.17 FR744355.1:59-484(+)